MREFKCERIADDLFNVYIDGVMYPNPCTLSEATELYEAQLKNEYETGGKTND